MRRETIAKDGFNICAARSTQTLIMEKLRYESIPRMSRAEINSAILRDDSEQLVYAVLSAALYDDDPEWAEDICVRLADHHSASVRGNAIVGFSHVARIHGTLSARVKPLVERALGDDDAWVRGHAQDVVDDLEVFLGWKIP